MNGTRVPLAAGDQFYRLRAERVAPFFDQVPTSIEGWQALARERVADPARRTELLRALEPHWRELQLSAAARDAIEALRDPKTQIVIAGQQPALAGGPLLLYSKLVSVIALADRLQRAGIPTVPLFWIADEDHDVGELMPGSFPGAGRHTIELPFARDRVCLSALEIADPESLIAEVAARLPSTSFGEWVLMNLRESIDRSPSRWFRDFTLRILAAREQAYLPVHPAWLRSLAAPILREEAARPGRLREQVGPAIARLEAANLPVPIATVESLPFFAIDDDSRRHRLTVDRDRVASRSIDADDASSSWSFDQLDQLIEREPERFSPDALLRPLIQDTLIEPLATVLGPTELGYHLELIDAYAARGIRRPIPSHRVRVRVVDVRDAERLRALDIDPTRLDEPVERLLPSRAAAELRRELSDHASGIQGFLDRLAAAPEASKPLEKRASRLHRRLQADFEKLAEAIDREFDVDVRDDRRFLRDLKASLWHKTTPAERADAAVSYLARFGPALIERIAESFDPFDEREVFVELPDQSKEMSHG